MKTITLILIFTFKAHGLVDTLANDFSKNELRKMGGTYMSELYLLLENEVSSQAYLKELLLIKKGVWSQYFFKKERGIYIKPALMQERSCEVQLEVYSNHHFFSFHCI